MARKVESIEIQGQPNESVYDELRALAERDHTTMTPTLKRAIAREEEIERELSTTDPILGPNISEDDLANVDGEVQVVPTTSPKS